MSSCLYLLSLRRAVGVIVLLLQSRGIQIQYPRNLDLSILKLNPLSQCASAAKVKEKANPASINLTGLLQSKGRPIASSLLAPQTQKETRRRGATSGPAWPTYWPSCRRWEVRKCKSLSGYTYVCLLMFLFITSEHFFVLHLTIATLSQYDFEY